MNGKPAGPTARARRARRAKDDRYATLIRKLVADRDGYCRIGEWENHPDDWHADDVEHDYGCEGKSEWAHLGDKKRGRTRGMPPDQRHTTAGSLMLCAKHHHAYDGGTLLIDGNDADLSLRFEYA